MPLVAPRKKTILKWKKTILLEKIQNLQKQLSKIYTVENHVQTEAEKSVPELEDVSKTFEYFLLGSIFLGSIDRRRS